ncbi:hypothetical protein BD413DRAFT_645991 [Trametes elegans]|nr:hypothetical protein BD413DRAFT_645991 [Trametes elegans]
MTDSASQPVIDFYDIPADVEGMAWSPNTWKTRFTLNYKNLPYKTIWVEYPTIADTCQALGVPPTTSWPDGTPMYTFPVVRFLDPRTGTTTALAESLAIARELDALFPSTPRVVPAREDFDVDAFLAALDRALSPHIQRVIAALGTARLHEESRAYYKRVREWQWGGGPMEQWAPAGSEARARAWAALKAGFGEIARWYGDRSDDGAGGGEGEKRFLVGDSPTFGDFAVGARLTWMQKVLGTESEEWTAVEEWHAGRWRRLLEGLQEFARVQV